MIYLIDASVYIFRAYYSMPPDMQDPDGNPVHAVFGFARFLSDLIERAKPEYIAVAFDESLESSFRNRLYPPYKANREPAPPDLKWQFGACREFADLIGTTALSSNEYEADDIIGTLVTRSRAAGWPSTVVTRDKDLAQLIRRGDIYWNYADNLKLEHHQIAQHYGVAAERFADYLALTGDSVDNIKGVPGVGPKTAAALLTEFATLEEIYQNIDRVAALPIRGASKLGAKLLEHRDAAMLARELTRIVCDMPLVLGTEAIRRRAPLLPEIEQFCDRLGFGPMLRRQAERVAKIAS